MDDLLELRKSPDIVLGGENSILKDHSGVMAASSYLDLNATGSFSLPVSLTAIAEKSQVLKTSIL